MIELRPLPSSFMLTSMIGLAIAGVYTFSGRFDATWGFTFLLIFGIMFVASVFSMTPLYRSHGAEKSAEKGKKSVVRRKPKRKK